MRGKTVARKNAPTEVSRRKFLAGVAMTGAATAASATGEGKAAAVEAARPAATRPSTVAAQAELATQSVRVAPGTLPGDRKSTRLNSSHQISYAVFCLKKKKQIRELQGL